MLRLAADGSPDEEGRASHGPRGSEIHGDRRLEGREDPTEANQSRRIPRKRPHVPVRDNHAPFDHRAARLLVPPPAGREHGRLQQRGAGPLEGHSLKKPEQRRPGPPRTARRRDAERASHGDDGGRQEGPHSHRNSSRREARGPSPGACPPREPRSRSSRGRRFGSTRTFDQPLLYTIEKMREMLEPWNPEREYEEGLFRQPVPEFDHRGVQGRRS